MGATWERWGPVVTVSLLSLPVAVGAVWLLTRARRNAGAARPLTSAACDVGMVVATAPWLWMLFTPVAGDGGVNLVPLVDLSWLAGAPAATVATQLIGNLAVFAGAGFLLPIRDRRFASLPRIGRLAAGASTLVEVSQFTFDIGRVSSVDDILLNTAGAVLAAALSRPWWSTPGEPVGDQRTNAR